MIEEVGTRRRLYWDLHDFSKGRGLEIGPLHRAIVCRDEADVRYVDVHDQAGLRAHYGADPNVPDEAIPHIDYTLIKEDGRTVSLAEAAAEGAPFDWVMASHVIEHVPDVIGWLADIAELVTDDGVLVLAVPDKRYCFDVHRPVTTVGQLLEAHELGARRPSSRAIYDYFTRVVGYTSAGLWRGEVPTYEQRIHGMEEAVQKVAEAADGTYVDCHVWLWTPETFVEQMQELRVLGRSAWFVEEIEPTPVGDLEFRVRLRHLPRGQQGEGPVLDEVVPSGERPDWLQHSVDQQTRIAELERTVQELRRTARRRGEKVRQRDRRLQRTERALARRTRRVQELEQDVRRRQQAIAALRGSAQWRVGGVLLAPARVVRRVLRRSR